MADLLSGFTTVPGATGLFGIDPNALSPAAPTGQLGSTGFISSFGGDIGKVIGGGEGGLIGGILNPAGILLNAVGKAIESLDKDNRTTEADVQRQADEWVKRQGYPERQPVEAPNYTLGGRPTTYYDIPGYGRVVGYIPKEGSTVVLTNAGVYNTQTGEVIGTPPFVPLPEPSMTAGGGGGGGSTADGGGDAGGDIGSLDPDPDLMEGDTIRAGNGWLYPNEKISSESSYPVKVHTNPDGSRVVVYSDGSERWDATSGVNPDFSKWPNRPQPSPPIPETSTRTTEEWVPIVQDWLIRFPNASEAEKQEAIQKYGVPAEAIQKAQEGIGTGGQGTGTGTGSSGSGDSTGAPVTPTQPTPQTPTLPRPGPSPAPNAGPQVTPGTGVGHGTGPGTGTGGGNGGGTGGLLGLNATRTTEMVFPELYQPKLERFTVLGNLLSNQPWRYRA